MIVVIVRHVPKEFRELRDADSSHNVNAMVQVRGFIEK